MKLKTKITKKLLFVGIISILLTAVSLSFIFWYFFTEQVKSDLETCGNLAAEEYYKDNYEDFSYFKENGVRVTLIDKEGNVVTDNSTRSDKAKSENHNDRPEIIEAREKGSGESQRNSATIEKTSYYYARLLDNGYVLRVSQEADSVFSLLKGFFPLVVIIVLYVFAICLIFSAEATNGIIRPIKDMVIDPENVTYEELIPFSNIIEVQREKIKKHIENLKQEKEKINVLIANMSEGFVLFDMEKNVLMKNESAVKLLQANDVIKVNIINFSRAEKFIKAVDMALKGESNHIDLKIEDKEIQVLVSPVFHNNVQNGAIALIMDVTEKKKAENMRREFTANVSHELKTPLTSISGYAEMIEYGMAKPEDVKVFAHKICDEAGRLVALISDILKLSQLDEPLEQNQKQNVNLLDIAKECSENLKINADKRNIKVSCKGEDAVILGDKSLIYELVYNLCDNAIRYNKYGGLVEISIKKKEDKAILTVKDTGIGIPPEHQNRIFERFYRVDKSRSKKTGGTGLGLAIVKYIAEQHNASISLDSKLNQGTEITVSFMLNNNENI